MFQFKVDRKTFISLRLTDYRSSLLSTRVHSLMDAAQYKQSDLLTTEELCAKARWLINVEKREGQVMKSDSE